MKAEFFGTCVENPFKDIITLGYVIDNAKEISKKGFLLACDIPAELKKDFKEYPNDFVFYRQKEIYFFTWSCIEHFYTKNRYYLDK